MTDIYQLSACEIEKRGGIIYAKSNTPDSGNTAIPAIHEYYRWLAIAYATTLTTLPIITLPCGLADCGMPLGIQLIGKPGGEYQLFQHARWLESIINWSCKPVDPVQFVQSAQSDNANQPSTSL